MEHYNILPIFLFGTKCPVKKLRTPTKFCFALRVSFPIQETKTERMFFSFETFILQTNLKDIYDVNRFESHLFAYYLNGSIMMIHNDSQKLYGIYTRLSYKKNDVQKVLGIILYKIERLWRIYALLIR